MVGHTLKALRLERGISPEDLACRLGKTRAIVYHYESARTEIPHDVALKLAEILEVDPSVFVPAHYKTIKVKEAETRAFFTAMRDAILTQVSPYPVLGAFLVRYWIHHDVPLSQEFLALFVESRDLLLSGHLDLSPAIKMYLMKQIHDCQEAIIQKVAGRRDLDEA